MTASEQLIDLSFPIRGATIPADHGFVLYSALSRSLPELHGNNRFGIHPIRGALVGGRQLALTPSSRLTLRLPADQIPKAIPIAGKKIAVAGSAMTVGLPEIRPLRPAATLASRLVTIAGFTEAADFLDAVRRQIASLSIAGEASLLERPTGTPVEGGVGSPSVSIRRTLQIHNKEIVGFAVLVEGLTAEASLHLQEQGIGGRRRFGCGIFTPARTDSPR